MSPVFEFEKLSYPEIDALERDKTLVFVPLSPLEEHGTHLPVGVDFFNAAFFARQAAENLTAGRPDLNVLLYPGIPIGTNTFQMVGSIWVSAKTLKRLIVEIASSLVKFGFRKIALFSAHGGPLHLLALEEACFHARRKLRAEIILPGSAPTIKFLRGQYTSQVENALGRPLTEEEKKALPHDFHAGWWETSMMLFLFPQLVKPEYKKLDPVLAGLKDLRTSAIPKLGKGEGYMGSPALASREFGQVTADLFCRIGHSTLLKLANNEDTSAETTTILTQIVRWKFWLSRTLVLSGIIIIILWITRGLLH